MRYYFLKNRSISIKEMGAIPQSETVEKIAYNSDGMGYEGPIEIPLIPPEPILLPNAKTTSVLNLASVNSGIFIVCRDYFVSFIKDFKLGEHNVWPMKIHQHDNILKNYHLFHISYPSDNELIDYKRSQFSIGEIGDWKDKSKRKKTIIKDYSNYINLREVLRGSGNQIKYDKIVLDINRARKDVLRLETPSVRGYYFSDRIVNELKKQRFTGFSFLEIGWRKKNVELINKNHNTL